MEISSNTQNAKMTNTNDQQKKILFFTTVNISSKIRNIKTVTPKIKRKKKKTRRRFHPTYGIQKQNTNERKRKISHSQGYTLSFPNKGEGGQEERKKKKK
jgi:hypothetical protein